MTMLIRAVAVAALSLPRRNRGGADRLGHAGALSGRQFPHPKRRAIRRRYRQGDRRIAEDQDPFCGFAVQASRNQARGASGTAPIGEILQSLAANESPVYASDSLPFLATGYDAAKKLYDVQKPYLQKQLESEGLMLLYSVPWPPQGLYAKRELNSINDLKGLKFRTYNPTIGRIASLAGAIPTQIEVPDLPTAFATGRVDVMITSASTGVDTKAQDYLTHYIDTQAWLPRNIVFVNKAAFDKLKPDEQKAVLEAAKAAEERGWKLSQEEMTIKTQALKDAKIIVMAPSADLKAGLTKIGETIAAEWAAKAGPEGQKMLEDFKK